MRNKAVLAGFVLSTILFLGGCARQEDPAVLRGPYLGQKLPGMTPEVFAPGIVSTPEFREFSGAFTPDGREYHFFRFADGAGMMMSRLTDEGRMMTQIWFIERRGDTWDVPKHLCEGMFVSSSRSGNIYLNDGVTRLVDGKFAPFQKIVGSLTLSSPAS